MKNHKQWKHQKEFDTKTLFEDLRKRDENSDENSESSGEKSVFSSKEKSERIVAHSSSDTIPKNTRIHVSPEDENQEENGGAPAKKPEYMNLVL